MASRQQDRIMRAGNSLLLQHSLTTSLVLCQQSDYTNCACGTAGVKWLLGQDCSPQLAHLIAKCAGADVLFVGKGADVGVTVSPIRINSLREFGTVEAVGDRLLGAEKAKASHSCCQSSVDAHISAYIHAGHAVPF